MKVLVIGQGGREHALVWKFAQSPLVTKIYAYPGNPGIAELATLVQVSSLEELKDFAIKEAIDLTVVGPEKYLAAGIADLFKEAGLAIFGPSQAAARLESSKAYAKAFMQRHNIPTAAFLEADDYNTACCMIKNAPYRLVVKADGLAQGKGVAVTESAKEAMDAVQQMLSGAFGEAGHKVILEERLEGPEISVLTLVEGSNYCVLPVAMDHKRAYDNDLGPNTGGMGAVAPIALNNELQEEIEKTIIKPTIEGLAKEGTYFSGVIFIGLMLTKNGPKVLEYNVRLGDPETQAVLPLVKNDLFTLLQDLKAGKKCSLALLEQVSCCVVVASKGYPGDYAKGVPINLPKIDQNQIIFHSGTQLLKDQLCSLGGRVLAVVGLGQDLNEARAKAYEIVEEIDFPEKMVRRDIGMKALSFQVFTKIIP